MNCFLPLDAPPPASWKAIRFFDFRDDLANTTPLAFWNGHSDGTPLAFRNGHSDGTLFGMAIPMARFLEWPF